MNPNSNLQSAPLGETLRQILHHVQNILRAEVQLAGEELRAKGQSALHAGPLLGMAAVLGLCGGASLVALLIFALHIALPFWLAALLMGILLGAAAGGAYLLGRLSMEEVDLAPQHTLETLKDHADWAKTRLR